MMFVLGILSFIFGIAVIVVSISEFTNNDCSVFQIILLILIFLLGLFLMFVSLGIMKEILDETTNTPQYTESWECVEFNYPEDTRCDFGNGFWNLNYLYAHDSGIELNLTKEQLCENIQGTIDKEKVCTKQIKVRELVQSE